MLTYNANSIRNPNTFTIAQQMADSHNTPVTLIGSTAKRPIPAIMGVIEPGRGFVELAPATLKFKPFASLRQTMRQDRIQAELKRQANRLVTLKPPSADAMVLKFIRIAQRILKSDSEARESLANLLYRTCADPNFRDDAKYCYGHVMRAIELAMKWTPKQSNRMLNSRIFGRNWMVRTLNVVVWNLTRQA